jgi:acetyltransferase-like isoleucine patch superfamily enzyme
MRSGYHAYRFLDRLTNKAVSLLVRGGFASFGKQSVIGHPVRLHGAERISIGAGVFIGSGSWLQVVNGAEPGDQPIITIGDRVLMSGACVVSAASSIVIEDGALFARNVYVADHGHAYGGAESIHAQGIDSVAPIRIGAGCWLGQNVVVLPGSDIGAGAVIGANSVVRGTVPDRCVAVGAPARVLRSIDPD